MRLKKQQKAALSQRTDSPNQDQEGSGGEPGQLTMFSEVAKKKEQEKEQISGSTC